MSTQGQGIAVVQPGPGAAFDGLSLDDASLQAWLSIAGAAPFTFDAGDENHGLGIDFANDDSNNGSDRSMPGSPSLSSSGSDLSEPHIATPPPYSDATETKRDDGNLDLGAVDLSGLYMDLGAPAADTEKHRHTSAGFPNLTGAAAGVASGDDPDPFQGITEPTPTSQNMASLASFMPATAVSAGPAAHAGAPVRPAYSGYPMVYPSGIQPSTTGSAQAGANHGVPYQPPYGSVPVGYPGFPYGYHAAYPAYSSYPSAGQYAQASVQANLTAAPSFTPSTEQPTVTTSSSMIGSAGSHSPPTPRDKDRKKRFACPDCGKLFARAFNLQTHAATHRGIKPFDCPAPDCGKSFSRRHDLGRHLQAVHEPWLVGTGQTAQGAAAPVKKRGHFRLKVSPVQSGVAGEVQMTEAPVMSPDASVGSQSDRSNRGSVGSATGSERDLATSAVEQQARYHQQQQQQHAAFLAGIGRAQVQAEGSASTSSMVFPSHFG